MAWTLMQALLEVNSSLVTRIGQLRWTHDLSVRHADLRQ
jgi:hypothetical protein